MFLLFPGKNNERGLSARHVAIVATRALSTGIMFKVIGTFICRKTWIRANPKLGFDEQISWEKRTNFATPINRCRKVFAGHLSDLR